MTFTAMRPALGLSTARDVSLFSVAQASSLISALSEVNSSGARCTSSSTAFSGKSATKPTGSARAVNEHDRRVGQGLAQAGCQVAAERLGRARHMQ